MGKGEIRTFSHVVLTEVLLHRVWTKQMCAGEPTLLQQAMILLYNCVLCL